MNTVSTYSDEFLCFHYIVLTLTIKREECLSTEVQYSCITISNHDFLSGNETRVNLGLEAGKASI
jgi:hypothetical protein